jgi:hypothetical protein
MYPRVSVRVCACACVYLELLAMQDAPRDWSHYVSPGVSTWRAAFRDVLGAVKEVEEPHAFLHSLFDSRIHHNNSQSLVSGVAELA